jgi:hypothetical protein
VALTPCSDVSATDWITASARPWQQLAEFGPPGFPAYARLRFLPDPSYEGQSENDVDVDENAPSETAQLRAVLEVLTRHTRTPGDCYFCLWDGWGRPLHDDGAVRTLDPPTDALGWRPARIGAEPGIDPSFSPSALHEPMVIVPNRAYFLFRGTMSRARRPGPGRGVAGPTRHGHRRPRVHLAGGPRLVRRQRRRPALGRDRRRHLGHRPARRRSAPRRGPSRPTRGPAALPVTQTLSPKSKRRRPVPPHYVGLCPGKG